MKAITLWQPWASAVAVNQKRFETRSWPTKYRGKLAIHSATRETAADALIFDGIIAQLHPIEQHAWAEYCESNYTLLPFGEIVATCELVDCIPTTKAAPNSVEALWGDFAPGRWAWQLANIERLQTPIPAVGRQGLWEWESPEIAAPARQLFLL